MPSDKQEVADHVKEMIEMIDNVFVLLARTDGHLYHVSFGRPFMATYHIFYVPHTEGLPHEDIGHTDRQ